MQPAREAVSRYSRWLTEAHIATAVDRLADTSRCMPFASALFSSRRSVRPSRMPRRIVTLSGCFEYQTARRTKFVFGFALLEFQLLHQLTFLRCSVDLLGTCRRIPGQRLRFCHDRLLQYPFQLNILLSFSRSMLCALITVTVLRLPSGCSGVLRQIQYTGCPG